ncbi:hypothetical protein [Cellulomonas sp. URHE0023]|uniref:hypothetical protein n=1 Tax=Cellulomonas sp. URHE0023 TaxID=1380354 RepID=UPI0012DD72B8|nr:hypothetical protein [Cellulomonas sp. URHE0023]
MGTESERDSIATGAGDGFAPMDPNGAGIRAAEGIATELRSGRRRPVVLIGVGLLAGAAIIVATLAVLSHF